MNDKTMNDRLAEALRDAMDDVRESVDTYHHAMRGYRKSDHDKLDSELAEKEALLAEYDAAKQAEEKT